MLKQTLKQIRLWQIWFYKYLDHCLNNAVLIQGMQMPKQSPDEEVVMNPQFGPKLTETRGRILSRPDMHKFIFKKRNYIQAC